MAARSLTGRVEILEQHVEELRELPPRVAAVESQILQLRGEMQSGISAIRGDVEALRGDVEAVRGDVKAVRGDIEETRRHMRVLHEEVLSRIALLVEGRGPEKR